jgi:hypothetical protein
MFVQRKWLGGVGNCFTSAPAASIDARSDGRFSGFIFLVELRTDADFYVIAAPKERHGIPSFVRKPQLFHGRRVAALYDQPAARVLRKDEAHMEICSSCRWRVATG